MVLEIFCKYILKIHITYLPRHCFVLNRVKIHRAATCLTTYLERCLNKLMTLSRNKYLGL